MELGPITSAGVCPSCGRWPGAPLGNTGRRVEHAAGCGFAAAAVRWQSAVRDGRPVVLTPLPWTCRLRLQTTRLRTAALVWYCKLRYGR